MASVARLANLLAALVVVSAPWAQGAVELVQIPGLRQFPEAVAPGAIQHACASEAELRRYFRQRGLRFSPELLRPLPGHGSCHIFYEPTIRGFRAATEERPIRSLIAAADPHALVLGSEPAGDGFSAVKHVLARLRRPMEVELRINQHYDPSHWPAALEFHFGNLPHRIQAAPTPGISKHPWAQDYVKSGAVGLQLKVLVPRRVFEGREADGEVHRPMLEELKAEPFVRSKLSWDGGDLLFVRHPRQPEQSILVHGGAALLYWGAGLSPEEYQWVLLTEFGADIGLALNNSAAHIDFVLSFLPDEPTVLVAQPVRANSRIALAIVDSLEEFWGRSAPATVKLLRASVERLFVSPNTETVEVRQQIEALRATSMHLRPPIDGSLARALDDYVAAHCSEQPASCFDNVEAQRRMMKRNRVLARQAANLGVQTKLFERLPVRLLSLLEGQLPDAPAPSSRLLNDRIQELRKMGFRVIRIPHLLGADSGRSWPGVGYANMLTVGRQIFIPTFELGTAERKLLADIEKKLRGRYEVVPVPARMSLLDNGGVHCVFGIIREP